MVAIPTIPPFQRNPDARSPERFLITLGTALHREGIPAHRLEAALTEVGALLGVKGQFLSTPTSLSAAFGEVGRQRTAMVRVDPGDLHLEKLVALDEVTRATLDGELDVEQGIARIEQIVGAPERYGPVVTTAAFAAVSGAAALLFGGGAREIAAAMGVGLEIGLLLLLAGRVPAVGRVLFPLAAAVAAAWAAILAWWTGPLVQQVVTLSALIVLVPGLTLTVAMNELSTGHLVSGTARLTGALVVFLQLGLGIVLGSQVAALLPAAGEATTAGLPAWALWPSTGVAALGLTVLFRARPRDVLPIVASCAVAMAGAQLGAMLVQPPGSAFVGALGVGLFGNLYARLTGRPSLVPIVPGLLLLVPGSVGFAALSAMLQHDVLSGVATAFTAGFSAVALAAGLLLAHAVFGARRGF
jgi:uncharacterized membrane protein YjjP (DUF1212 family)